jgi:hypothetical protein
MNRAEALLGTKPKVPNQVPPEAKQHIHECIKNAMNNGDTSCYINVHDHRVPISTLDLEVIEVYLKAEGYRCHVHSYTDEHGSDDVLVIKWGETFFERVKRWFRSIQEKN